MGLISFVKSAGRKVGLFGGREAAEAEAAAAEAKAAAEAAAADAAEAAQEHAVAMDIRAAILSYVAIDDLQVSFSGETAVISGTAPSQADAERAILVAGNTEGVAHVDGNIEVVEPEPPAVYHTVVAGDTLSELSGRYYGVIRLYDAIFSANQPMLEHPDEIYPGQVLRIPPVATPTHTVSAGETLGTIAKHWYGEASRYEDIFAANTDVLPNADSVEVGQVLTIPLIDPKVELLA